jgi:hypothetical protein
MRAFGLLIGGVAQSALRGRKTETAEPLDCRCSLKGWLERGLIWLKQSAPGFGSRTGNR